MTIEDIRTYNGIGRNLAERCFEVFKKYQDSKILLPTDTVFLNFEIDSINQTIDIYYRDIDDFNHRDMCLTLSWDVIVSDEKVEDDIRKRLDERKLKLAPYEFMRGSKIYIAGKMTGLSKENILENFSTVEKYFNNQGYATMNPAVLWHLDKPENFNPKEYLEINYAMIRLCDALIVLPNSEDSHGTACEIKYANKLNIPVYYLGEDYSIYVMGDNNHKTI